MWVLKFLIKKKSVRQKESRLFKVMLFLEINFRDGIQNFVTVRNDVIIKMAGNAFFLLKSAILLLWVIQSKKNCSLSRHSSPKLLHSAKFEIFMSIYKT